MRASASAHSRQNNRRGEQPVPPARIRSYPERVRDTRHDELRMFAVAATRASTRLVLTAVRNDDQAPGEFFDFVLPTARSATPRTCPSPACAAPPPCAPSWRSFAAPSLRNR